MWSEASAGDVTFDDRSDVFALVAPKRWLSDGVTHGWTLALAAGDLNGDLLPEIYVANDFGSDRLLLNRSTVGNPKFELVEGRRDVFTPRSKVLGQDSYKGMGVDFGDVSGDGRPAIAVSNIAEEYGLMESHFLFVHTGQDADWERGVAPYRDESVARGVWTGGWGWDIKFADLNNSGRPQILQTTGFVKGSRNRWPELQELAMGNDELLKKPFAWPRFGPGDDLSGTGSHDRLFVADDRGIYHDVWLSLDPKMGRDTVSRGIATGDVDGDGHLSVLIARQWMPSVFIRNKTPTKNRWLSIDLRLANKDGGDRAAIGATAQVTLDDGRLVTGCMDAGSGHGGRRAPEIHLGLGQSIRGGVADVSVAWRDGKGLHRRTYHLDVNKRHRIVLDAGAVAQLETAAPDLQ